MTLKIEVSSTFLAKIVACYVILTNSLTLTSSILAKDIAESQYKQLNTTVIVLRIHNNYENELRYQVWAIMLKIKLLFHFEIIVFYQTKIKYDKMKLIK